MSGRTRTHSAAAKPRSLPFDEWPESDRTAWAQAFRAGTRFHPGGPGSHLAEVSRRDLAQRYGAYLGFIQRAGRLRQDASAAVCVNPADVEAYRSDLSGRVLSTTQWNCIYKLRLVGALLAPDTDFTWLREIENDLVLLSEPRSKLPRLVMTQRLVEAGLTLIAEAETFAHSEQDQARGLRNGLMIALLAFCPIRLKNFISLEIGKTFKQIDGHWWIVLAAKCTKTHRADERRVPDVLSGPVNTYLEKSRPTLLRRNESDLLWISSTTGRGMTAKNAGTLISKLALQTIGVDVSPHLFRTAAASTAAAYGPATPNLASAILNHADPRIAEEHYMRTTSIGAARAYADLAKKLTTC